MRRLAAAAVLTAALVSLAGCGGETTTTAMPQTVVGTVQQVTIAKGNPTAGKQVFAGAGCGSCHTLKAAGSTGTVGPDLDKALKGKTPEFIRESIVNPNAEITPGFPPNVMPGDFGTKLSTTQLADLIAFLTQKPS
jgi:mono/diheme cytochrome c family protein